MTNLNYVGDVLEFKVNVGDDINNRDKPEKLTQYGAFKVIPIELYVLPEIKNY